MWLLFLACTKPKEEFIQTPITGAQHPHIQVTPPEIAYGLTGVGDTVEHSETVTITNTGGGALQIVDISLDDPGTPFKLSSVGSVLVPPGMSTSFTVTFMPTLAETWETVVLIQSDDPDAKYSFVRLKGTGVAPVIRVDPKSYDFRAVSVGCHAELTVQLLSIGNAELTVTGMSYVTDSSELSFDVGDYGPYPLTIVQGAELNVIVNYDPVDTTPDEGYLSVFSDDPEYAEVQAFQKGVGIEGQCL